LEGTTERKLFEHRKFETDKGVYSFTW